jgi:LPXTG-motif cell wall-anchored protein
MAGLVVLAGFVGASPAQSAEAYGVEVTITSVTKFEDQTYKVSAKASPGVDCDWTLKNNAAGQTITEEDGGSTISHTFHAQDVSHDTTFSSKATCKYSGKDPAFPVPEALGGFGGALGFATAVAAPVHTASDSGTVTILDRNGNGNGNGHHHKKNKNKDDDDDNGNLPNTGGERLAWLVIGLLLVAAGSTVVVSSRKRESVS